MRDVRCVCVCVGMLHQVLLLCCGGVTVQMSAELWWRRRTGSRDGGGAAEGAERFECWASQRRGIWGRRVVVALCVVIAVEVRIVFRCVCG